MKDIDYLKTKDKILYSAINEFKNKGYEKASLRSIANSANVTTGAVYTHFKNKDDLLFEAVKPLAIKFQKLATPDFDFSQYYKNHTYTFESSLEKTKVVLELIFNDYDRAYIFFMNLNCKVISNFFNKAIKYEQEYTIKWLEAEYGTCNEMTKFFIHTISEDFFQELAQIFQHDLTKKQAYEYMEKVTIYHCAGWNTIFSNFSINNERKEEKNENL